jgi:hypothetical protein
VTGASAQLALHTTLVNRGNKPKTCWEMTMFRDEKYDRVLNDRRRTVMAGSCTVTTRSIVYSAYGLNAYGSHAGRSTSAAVGSVTLKRNGVSEGAGQSTRVALMNVARVSTVQLLRSMPLEKRQTSLQRLSAVVRKRCEKIPARTMSCSGAPDRQSGR